MFLLYLQMSPFLGSNSFDRLLSYWHKDWFIGI